MLKINLEFRKGVLFVRLNGSLNDKDSLDNINSLINEIGFKYIVFNVDNLKCIDINGINCILNYNELLIHNNGKLLLCESDNIISNRIFKNKIPYIANEIQAFDLI
jgi:hypothetical protein